MVPGPSKREAVRNTLRGPVSEACPASVLRRHEACTLYLDRDSYGE
jgi:glucosamine-6-phosphate deaminase